MSVNKVNSDGSLSRVAGGTLYADEPIGAIIPFGGSVVPSGYLLCNGAEVLKTAYAELYAVIGDAFGTASDNTKFKLPDLREAVPKGVGLSSKSSVHYDSDGVALGEFIEDRVQTHTHGIYYSAVAPSGGNSGVLAVSGNIIDTAENGGRKGNTTEVKAVGANYIIKAKQVAVPFDLEAQLDVDYQKKDLTSAINIGGVDRTTVELALSALNDLLKPTVTKVNIDPTYASGYCGYFKIGKIVIVLINGLSTLVGGSPTVVASGQLPVPANTGLPNANYNSILKEGASNTAGANYLCWLDPNGGLHVEGVVNSPTVYGELIYIAKDY